jgi:secreted Zn-dependent insulinase-like peptidase
MRLWDDALCAVAYQADVAGLAVDGWPEGTAGVEVRLDGFSDKLPTLADAAFRALAAPACPPDPAAFTRVRETLAREYRNAHVRPDRHAAWTRLACLKRAWAPDAVLAELNALTPATLASLAPTLLADCCVEALVQGNVSAGGAADLARGVRRLLATGAPLPASARPDDAVTALPRASSTLVRAPAVNPVEVNAAVEVYLQLGPDTPAARAALDLAAHAAHEPAYNTLRTKEQLGYAVHAGARCTHGVLGYAVTVASGDAAPAHIDARVDTFLASFADTLATMPAADLEAHRAALTALKRQADASLADEAARHWDRVSARAYDFGGREEELAALPSVTRDELVALWRGAIAPGGAERRRLAVHVVPTRCAGDLDAPPPPGVTLAPDPDAVREAHPKAAGRGAAGEARVAAARAAAGL